MISVIIPVYNGAESLEACLRSVTLQSYSDLEIIVIDDGSTDDSYLICERLMQLDGRIRLIKQANAGVSAARNRGLSLAHGEYVTFVDADDILLPDAFLEIPMHPDLIVFDRIMSKSYRNGIYIKGIQGEAGLIDITTLEYNWIMHEKLLSIWGMLYKREFLNGHDIRFDTTLIQGEDAHFNYMVLRYKPISWYCNKAIYQYQFSTSTLKNRWRKKPDLMISNSLEYFEYRFDYVSSMESGDRDRYRTILLEKKIRSFFYHAIDLCEVSQDSEQRKERLAQIMAETDVPEDCGMKTRIFYNCIVKGKWHIISLAAKVRLFYHAIMRI